jgi:hypothetical protein
VPSALRAPARLTAGVRHRTVTQLLSTSEDFIRTAANVVRAAPVDFPPTLPSRPELLGAPEWYRFELDVWPIGEVIRQSFIHSPKMKKDWGTLEAIVRVVECKNLRRGRQSFVMALAFVGAREFAPRLAVFLDDPDLDGQVVDTLIKMKAPGYTEAVGKLMSSENLWIRKLAKRYIERFPQ